jgi:hypothetical protein
MTTSCVSRGPSGTSTGGLGGGGCTWEWLRAGGVSIWCPGVVNPQPSCRAAQPPSRRLTCPSPPLPCCRHYYTLDEARDKAQQPHVQALLRLCRFRNAHPAFKGRIYVDDACPSHLCGPGLAAPAALCVELLCRGGGQAQGRRLLPVMRPGVVMAMLASTMQTYADCTCAGTTATTTWRSCVPT